MNAVDRAPSPDDGLPLPARQMNLYLTFWHIVYLGVLAVLLWTTWVTFGATAPWRPAVITALAAGQVGLYLWNFVFNEVWPLPAWRITLYFLGSAALWLIEWRIAPDFQWFGMTYFGQMMGTLPPPAALPGSLLVFILVFIVGPDFSFPFESLTSSRVLSPLFGWGASMVLYLFIFYITRTSQDRGRLVHDLRAAQVELEAARQRETELAVLRERERLARDLHDSLGHALVAISVQLEAIQRLYRVDPARAEAQVEALKGVARSNMDELRRSLLGLRAPGLGDQPLAEALRALCLQTGQRTGLDVACQVTGDPLRLTPAAAETLWRVAQEALTNVEKHAQARHLQVSLDVQADAAVLRVRDDGRGLPPGSEALPGHYGLRGMRERVEGVGGTLQVTNDAGTLIEARVPVVR